MLRWYIQAVCLQMAHEASCARGKAAHWQSLLFKLVFILLRYAQWLGPYENKSLFSENFKMLPKNCVLQNCILAGKEVLGRTKSAAWLSSERGRTAGVQLGCMDHCWLTLILQKLTVVLKINGPSMNNWFSGISTGIIQLCEGVSLVLFP